MEEVCGEEFAEVVVTFIEVIKYYTIC